MLATLPLSLLTFGTNNIDTFAEVSVNFRFGPLVLVVAFAMTLAMGVFGGLFPAIRAVRMDVISVAPRALTRRRARSGVDAGRAAAMDRDRSEPALLLDRVGLVEVGVGLGQVEDPLDQADHSGDDASRSSRSGP